MSVTDLAEVVITAPNFCLAGYRMRDGGMNRRQLRLDFLAVRLEPWREHEMLPERGWIFVDGKSWSVGGELEEYATGLEEINRFEPEAVDGVSGAAPRSLDPVADP